MLGCCFLAEMIDPTILNYTPLQGGTREGQAPETSTWENVWSDIPVNIWTHSLEQKCEGLTSKTDASDWHTDEKEQKGQYSLDAINPRILVKGNSSHKKCN